MHIGYYKVRLFGYPAFWVIRDEYFMVSIYERARILASNSCCAPELTTNLQAIHEQMNYIFCFCCWSGIASHQKHKKKNILFILKMWMRCVRLLRWNFSRLLLGIFEYFKMHGASHAPINIMNEMWLYGDVI